MPERELEMCIQPISTALIRSLVRVSLGVMLASATDAGFFLAAQSVEQDHRQRAGTAACEGLRGKLIESVPFEIVHGLPVITVRVENHEAALFLLDSGAEATFINKDDVVRLGFKLVPSNYKLTMTGTAAVTVSEHATFAKSIKVFVGKRYKIQGSALTADLTEFSHAAGVHLSGVIGYNLLRTRPMALDYRRHRLLIYKKIADPEETSFLSETIDPSKSVAVIASILTIAGKNQGEVKFEIDTGNDAGALIGSAFSESHELTGIDGWKKTGSMGYNGSMMGLGGLPGSVSFGGQTLPISSVDLSANSAPVQAAYDLTVGSPAFADRCLLFDAPKGKVYLSRLPADIGDVVPREEPQR